MPKILLTHTPEALRTYYGDRALSGLRALGDVNLNPIGRVLAGRDLVAAASDCEIIVADRQTPGEPLLFAQSPRLVAFVRGAVDIRTVDVEAASANGVLVTRASPGFICAVAELVLGFLVDLARGVTRATIDYRAGIQPEARIGVQLQGSTLGVIGYGAIGRRVAALGVALGMRVLVSDPYANIEEAGIEQTDLSALLAAADFVVCLAVANTDTENLMDDAAFARMKRGAYFVNVSRGNLVDEAALARALDSKHLAGAAIDVGRAPDQMPSIALAARGDVIATPHIGGLTPQAAEHQAMETVAQVAEIVQGRVPGGAVNAERATRLKGK